MPFNDPKGALEDILENIARIERYVFGMDEDAFRLDDTTMDAVERNLPRISEAAKRLGAQATVLCPGIPWHEIRGLGNWLRHDYDQIKVEVIWKTVRQDPRPLQLSAALALNRIDEMDGPESG